MPQARSIPQESTDSDPKTTRPAARSRRPPIEGSAARALPSKLDALPDSIDIRDWFYQPTLAQLADELINCNLVPKILDQGREGACTGYALAAVINFQLAKAGVRRFVSPRMLYELARRYDEWPGENYEGSSARAAMKAWVRHGVCLEKSWHPDQQGPEFFTPAVAKEAMHTPGGAFYRVMHKQVRDMHAALNELGILYITLMVHQGWAEPSTRSAVTVSIPNRHGKARTMKLPVITRIGQAEDGHAVAIVGYSKDGFVIQNSWSEDWGAGGFALLPYEDYILHATDVWAAQLGVPVSIDIWQDQDNRDTSAGLYRAQTVIPLEQIRPYTIDVGNNGELSKKGNYWTTEADIERLFAEVIPETTKKWSARRILLYLHGGLNGESDVAKRVIAFRDVLLENEIYPIHIMWESGLWETIRDIFGDVFTDVDRARGIQDWLRKTREGLTEAKDRGLELTASLPGTALWSEMKENAELSSTRPAGAMQLLTQHASAALKQAKNPQAWDLHVVAHSAGSIYTAYALPLLLQLAAVNVNLKSMQFFAPAMTTALFENRILSTVGQGCPHPSLYILSDVGERDDDLGPYGKSLLYMVSNSFEGKRETPLLGMARFIKADAKLSNFFQQQVDGLPSLVVAGASSAAACVSRSESHGGFDNDKDTMNSMLRRILGTTGPLRREFTDRDLQY